MASPLYLLDTGPHSFTLNHLRIVYSALHSLVFSLFNSEYPIWVLWGKILLPILLSHLQRLFGNDIWGLLRFAVQEWLVLAWLTLLPFAL